MLIPLKDQNPTERAPVLTVTLIGLNVIVFVLTGFQPGLLDLLRYGAIPCELFGECPPDLAEQYALLLARQGQPVSVEVVRQALDRPVLLSLITSMFMHAGFLHIGGNMLYLWIFGNNIEDRLGRVGFVMFYLATGLVASGAHVLLNTGSAQPVVGASGAVSGVLGAYLVLFPHARVLALVPLGFFFFTVQLPAGVLLVVYFVLQLFGVLGGGSSVAFAAHIGGFVAGWLLIRVFPKRRRRLDTIGPL